MPFDLEELIIVKEFKGNDRNRVFLVENKNNGQKMILKIIKIQDLEKEVLEIEIHKKLDTRFVIKLIEYEITSEYILIYLEYAAFGDLFSNLKEILAGPEKNLLKFFYKFVQIVKYIHEQGFVHRDIKPENILICKKMTPKLSDFGTTGNKSLIKNTFCGTVEYMSPEIFFGEQQTEKVDIWALGILLFEMTHGFPPFRRENQQQMQKLILRKKINFRSDLNPMIRQLIERILQYESEKRPTAQEVLADALFFQFRKPKKNKAAIVSKKYRFESEKLKLRVKEKIGNAGKKYFISELKEGFKITDLIRKKINYLKNDSQQNFRIFKPKSLNTNLETRNLRVDRFAFETANQNEKKILSVKNLKSKKIEFLSKNVRAQSKQPKKNIITSKLNATNQNQVSVEKQTEVKSNRQNSERIKCLSPKINQKPLQNIYQNLRYDFLVKLKINNLEMASEFEDIRIQSVKNQNFYLRTEKECIYQPAKSPITPKFGLFKNKSKDKIFASMNNIFSKSKHFDIHRKDQNTCQSIKF